MARIPGIYVEIKGDSTQLRKDITAARNIVTDSAKGMSNALNNALDPTNITKGTNALIKSLSTLDRASQNTEKTFKSLAVDLGALQRVTGITDTQFAKLQARMLQTSAQNAQERALRNIARAADLSEKEIRQLGRQFDLTDKQIDKVNASLRKTPQSLGVVNRVAGSVKASILGIGAAWLSLQGFSALSRVADEYTNIDSKLKLVTADTAEFHSVYAELFKMSQETGSSLVDNAKNYANLALALQDTKISSAELLSVFADLNRSLVVAGASTAEQSSFMLQFKQALGANRLAGDEFKAMLEANSYWAGQFAKALGTDITGLYEMKEAGELTTSTVLDAHKRMSASISSDFGGLQKTIGRATTEMRNAWQDVIADANRSTGSTNKIAESISDLAKVVTDNKGTITDVFSGIIAAATSTVEALARVSRSIQGLAIVAASKDKSLWDWIKADPEDMKAWQKEIDDGTAFLKDRLAEVRSQMASASQRRGRNSGKNETLARLQAEEKQILQNIAAIERLKLKESSAVSTTAGKSLSTSASDAAATSSARIQKDAADKAKNSISELLEYQAKGAVLGRDMWLKQAEGAKLAMERVDQEVRVDSALEEYFADIDNTGSETFAGLENAVSGWAAGFGKSLSDALWDADFTFSGIAESFGRMLTEMAIQSSIVQPLLNGLFGAGGFLNFAASAQGNVFSGSGISAYSNTIVDTPTLFPFARGIGLMGEAGAEAIMPLTRLPGGDLGVKSQGGSNVNVNIINNAGVDISTKETPGANGGIDFEIILDRAVGKLAGRTGTATNKAIMSSTSSSVPLVRR